MTKRVLILLDGSKAGLTPRYFQAAQHLGLYPVIMSSDRARYDRLVAEGTGAIHVDTDNLDALIRECSRLRATYEIAGITSPREEVYATIGKLCRHFGLPGPNPVSVERCCDKFTQRQLLAEAGVPIPEYRLAENAADVKSSAADIGLPVVLKPTIGIGSIGVRLCRTIDELDEHTNYLLGGKHIWRSPPKMLVEEFAQGPHYSIDIMGNEVVGIAALDFRPPPQFVCYECTYPAVLTHAEHRSIADVSLSCLRSLGLGWGPTNVELRRTKRGPVVIEVNPRIPGAPCPELVQLAYGVDLVTEHIRLVIGDEWDLRRSHSQTAAVQFLIPERDGTLEIDDDTLAAAVPGVADVKWYIEPKSPIVRKGDSRDCIGCVIAASPSLAQTKATLQHAVDLIVWSITPFPNAEK